MSGLSEADLCRVMLASFEQINGHPFVCPKAAADRLRAIGVTEGFLEQGMIPVTGGPIYSRRPSA